MANHNCASHWLVSGFARWEREYMFKVIRIVEGDVQTSYFQVKAYEVKSIQANCVLVMRKVDY